jgi:pilus assembly protein FimV
MAAGAAFALALLGGGTGNTLAAPASATSATDAASAVGSTTVVVAIAAGTQYTVHAGQSLNDVAIAITQSHDRAVLARTTRALFDTNPAAFMNHDPSRVRVGAVLIVPALDTSGALAASSAGAAAGASESTAAASAPTAEPAAAATAAASTASAVEQVNAAAASAASAAANATTSAAPAVAGTASAPIEGSAAVSTGAAASGTQGWAGSIQPSSSAAAGQAPSTTTAASQPHPQVSSLQQLLALKNRVLMELQKHGIGGAQVASGPAPTSAAQPAAAGSAAAVAAAPQQASVATAPSDESGMSQRDLSIAAAVGAALVVLLTALRMGRRKREKEAAARAAEAADGDMTRSTPAADSREGSVVAGQAAVPEESRAHDQELAKQAAAAAAERAAAERAAAEQAAAESAAAERAAADRAAAEEAEAERAAAEQAEAERRAAEQAAAERAAAERAAAEEHAEAERAAAQRAEAERIAAECAAAEQAATQETHLTQPGTHEPTAPTASSADIALSSESEASSEPPALTPTHDGTLSAAATAANLAAAAELGAEALPLGPLEPLEPVIGGTHDERADGLQWDDESTESPTAEKTPGATTTTSPTPTETPSSAPHAATAEPHTPLNVPPPVIDYTQHPVEPRATTSFGQPFGEMPVPAQPAPSAPTEFPREAVDAFSSLNMPLPPRIEVPPTGDLELPTSLSTQPVASPETTAQQAFGHDSDHAAPHIAEQIAAGTAGPGAVAGLGAAGFGALKLDFDLELPPSPAQPLPAFTPADLGRIARNKLELASEYIELGDLAGARTLINEVIEANDPATRTEARALLSTLAPLS